MASVNDRVFAASTKIKYYHIDVLRLQLSYMLSAKISVTGDRVPACPMNIVCLCVEEPSSEYRMFIGIGETTVPLTRYVSCAIHVMV